MTTTPSLLSSGCSKFLPCKTSSFSRGKHHRILAQVAPRAVLVEHHVMVTLSGEKALRKLLQVADTRNCTCHLLTSHSEICEHAPPNPHVMFSTYLPAWSLKLIQGRHVARSTVVRPKAPKRSKKVEWTECLPLARAR